MMAVALNRHRRRHSIERYLVEELSHVLDGVDGHANAPDLTCCE